jgi:hypothetical protein
MSDEQLQTLPYSVRIERSAKGARWTVHCYNKDLSAAMDEAVKAYDEVGKKLEERGLTVAPVEKGKGSE